MIDEKDYLIAKNVYNTLVHGSHEVRLEKMRGMLLGWLMISLEEEGKLLKKLDDELGKGKIQDMEVFYRDGWRNPDPTSDE